MEEIKKEETQVEQVQVEKVDAIKVTTTQPDKTMLNIIWALFAVSFLVGGITAIAGVIFAYIQKNKNNNELEADNCRYAIRTFWFGLLWASIGFILTFVLIGIPILLVAGGWWIYRIVKGYLYARDGKFLYPVTA